MPRSLLMILQDSKDLLHASRKDFSKIEAQLATKFEDIQASCTKFSMVGRPEGWWQIVKGLRAPCSTWCALSTCMTTIVSPAIEKAALDQDRTLCHPEHYEHASATG